MQLDIPKGFRNLYSPMSLCLVTRDLYRPQTKFDI